MNCISSGDLKALFAVIADAFRDNCAYLCELDAQMGDGDLGLTMKKGFAAAAETIETMEEPAIGRQLMQAGMKMASAVPSTMGTLMASGLMSAGKAVGAQQTLDAGGYVQLLNGFCDGIARRGKCVPGDRTILDALEPARQAAAAQYADGASLPAVAEAALQGAQQGVEATRQMRPRFGKAAVFAAKAAGVADQGAIAGMLLLRAICSFVCG